MAVVSKNVRAAYARMFCGADGGLHEDAREILADLRKFCQVDKGGLVVSPVQRTTDIPATMYRLGLVDAYSRIEKILEDDIGVIDDDRRNYAER